MVCASGAGQYGCHDQRRARHRTPRREPVAQAGDLDLRHEVAGGVEHDDRRFAVRVDRDRQYTVAQGCSGLEVDVRCRLGHVRPRLSVGRERDTFTEVEEPVARGKQHPGLPIGVARRGLIAPRSRPQFGARLGDRGAGRRVGNGIDHDASDPVLVVGRHGDRRGQDLRRLGQSIGLRQGEARRDPVLEVGGGRDRHDRGSTVLACGDGARDRETVTGDRELRDVADAARRSHVDGDPRVAVGRPRGQQFGTGRWFRLDRIHRFGVLVQDLHDVVEESRLAQGVRRLLQGGR